MFNDGKTYLYEYFVCTVSHLPSETSFPRLMNPVCVFLCSFSSRDDNFCRGCLLCHYKYPSRFERKASCGCLGELKNHKRGRTSLERHHCDVYAQGEGRDERQQSIAPFTLVRRQERCASYHSYVGCELFFLRAEGKISAVRQESF